MPIPREDFMNLSESDRAEHRIQTSCYRCIRSHRNQRDHRTFDRLDAAQLLEQLVTVGETS
jgi:hypothetical protein